MQARSVFQPWLHQWDGQGRLQDVRGAAVWGLLEAWIRLHQRSFERCEGSIHTLRVVTSSLCAVVSQVSLGRLVVAFKTFSEVISHPV